MTNAEKGSIRAINATMTSGKIIRMPKTAMAIPHVINRRRQTGVISLSTVAFTTALSKDKETSRTAKTATMNIVERAPTQLPLASQPKNAPRPSPAIVTRNELRKYLIAVRTYPSRLAQSRAPVQSPAAILTKVVQRQDSQVQGQPPTGSTATATDRVPVTSKRAPIGCAGATIFPAGSALSR